MKIKSMLKTLLGTRLCYALRVLANGIPRQKVCPYFDYDMQRFYSYSGVVNRNVREAKLDRVIIFYHIIEKGLTMPNRHLFFGCKAMEDLIRLVDEFEADFGRDPQVDHAVGVVRAYWELHMQSGYVFEPRDEEYWSKIRYFLQKHPAIPAAVQPHVTRAEFFANKDAPFPVFAWSRHTSRHYSGKDLSLDRIKQAVDLARSTPTACNRQHCRVYCLTKKELIEKFLALQDGNRGFGNSASKLLVVVADLEGIPSIREHNDIFVCGGMFLMNLCYALFHYEIAHCVLNWSRTPEEDLQMRKLIRIKPSETVIAVLTCGEAPEEFDVAASPRKVFSSAFMITEEMSNNEG